MVIVIVRMDKLMDIQETVAIYKGTSILGDNIEARLLDPQYGELDPHTLLLGLKCFSVGP
jgi:hypothetical protein